MAMLLSLGYNFDMIKNINQWYLVGGLILVIVGLFSYFFARTPGDAANIFIILFGVIFMLYYFRVLTKNKYTNTSFYLLVFPIIAYTILNIGVDMNLWPAIVGGELSNTSTTYLFLMLDIFIIIGVIYLFISLFVGMFHKREENES